MILYSTTIVLVCFCLFVVSLFGWFFLYVLYRYGADHQPLNDFWQYSSVGERWTKIEELPDPTQPITAPKFVKRYFTLYLFGNKGDQFLTVYSFNVGMLVGDKLRLVGGIDNRVIYSRAYTLLAPHPIYKCTPTLLHILSPTWTHPQVLQSCFINIR